MGQNVTGDVIPGCRDGPRGDLLVCWWELDGNTERLTGRWREHRGPEEETEIHSKLQKEGRWERG